ncbi:MAG TPA: glycosyltransferase family 9 protein [Gaiellales bacterium]|nr:glycosyltransferase family 9 protein [Gaiellales bacterium]
MSATLVVRLDNDGDVLLAGPAIRAVASSARVSLLCGRRGRAAAELLPGVSEVIEWTAPWIDPDPEPVDLVSTLSIVSRLRNRFAEAIILTSFHQSALPTALLLRLAAVETVAAISEDYPGSLLDVRHHPSDGLHEVERSLELVATRGHLLPASDDGSLRVRRPAAGHPVPEGPYVVLHPGASVTARTPPPDQWQRIAAALAAEGYRVVVTGGPGERAVAGAVAHGAGAAARSLAGETSLAELAEVIAAADAIIVGNTGPAHLAAAVGTPVVSLFAPTVPPERWRPWRVPHVLLGDLDIACAGCRARACPVPGHPCLTRISERAVVDALAQLTAPKLLAAAG